MDRRRLIGVAAAVAALAACGGSSGVVGRGTLGYAVALTDDRLYTVELDERFALIVRDRRGRPLARHDLGPPERDLLAVAVAGDRAAVGGADRQVRMVALDDGRVVATWPHGAIVTALATVDARWLVIGDRDGGLCVRRLDDGALVHCVDLGAPVVTAQAAPGRVTISTTTSTVTGAIPALTLIDAPAPAVVVRDREVIVDGRVVARFAGPARAVARDGRGWAAVGWIRSLGDASVIVGGSSVSSPRH